MRARSSSAILFGLGLLGVASLGTRHIAALSDTHQTLFQSMPYAIYLVGAIVAAQFGQSRAFFSVGVLIFSYTILYLNNHLSLTFDIENYKFLVSLATPVLGAILIFGSDNGIINSKGQIRLFCLSIASWVLVWSIEHAHHISHAAFLQYFPWLDISRFTTSHVLYITWVVVALILLVRTWRKPEQISYAMLCVLLGVAFSWNDRDDPIAIAGYYSAMGLLLIVAVLRTAYAMAFIDALCGLPNRRSLENRFMRLPRRYAIAMIDVDHFKKFNDTYGHDVGDQVLKMVANQLKQVTGGGKAARFGGEEFTIVFPRKSVEEVLPHLEQIRQSIETARFTIRGPQRTKKSPRTTRRKNKTVNVTVSLGVAERSREHNTPHAVVKRADQALYRAKKKGRNCVCK